jgi:oxepin-CoA hydrolase/3-oxo-5,6-dehydrosuberyl-CoA semialdehyde dehydrogenase
MSMLRVGDSRHGERRSREDVRPLRRLHGDDPVLRPHRTSRPQPANPLFGGIVAHGYLRPVARAGLVRRTRRPGRAGQHRARPAALHQARQARRPHPRRAHLRQQEPRTPEQGEVRWDVQVLDQDDVLVASYELLTMVSA